MNPYEHEEEAFTFDEKELAEFNEGVERARIAYHFRRATFPPSAEPHFPELDSDRELAPYVRPVRPIDSLAIEARLAGHEVPLTVRENRELVRRALARDPDAHDDDIAIITGLSERTVQRHRNRLGIPARPVLETPRLHRD